MKEKVKKAWSAFGAYPAQTKVTLAVFLFVAVSIPFSLAAALTQKTLSSRAGYSPVSPPSPPVFCQSGYQRLVYLRGSCGGDTMNGVDYFCHDGSGGTLRSNECHSLNEFTDLANNVCRRISKPVCRPLVTPTPVAVKGFGKAIKLNSQGEGVKVKGDVINTSLLTIEAWVKWEGPWPIKNDQYIVRKRETNNLPYNDTFSIFVSGAFGGQIIARVMTGSGVMLIRKDNVLRNRKWHHLALVNDPKDHKQTTRFYVDGKLVGSQRHLTPLIYGKGDFLIGMSLADNKKSTETFYGQIDEVMVSGYAKYKSNFDPPSRPFSTSASTQALYHLDGNARDASGNGNNGQIIGNVEFVDSTISGPTVPEVGFKQAVQMTNNKAQTNYLKLKTGENRAIMSYLANSSGTVETWIKLDKGVKNRVGILSQEGVGSLSLLPVRGNRYRLFFSSEQLGSVMGGSANNQLVTPGRWYHVALTREASSGAVALFLNGKKVGKGGKKPAAKKNRLFLNLRRKENTQPGTMIVGGRQLADGRVVNGFPGLIDELRFSSLVRYRSDFTVPKKPFLPDPATLFLWHFDKNFKDEIRGVKVEAVGPVSFAPGLNVVWAN